MNKYYFEENGRIYLIRCPKCERENYAFSVPTGQCYWCGYIQEKTAK